MYYFNGFFCWLLVFIFCFNINLTNASCDSDDIQTISECYNEHIFRKLRISPRTFATEQNAKLALSTPDNLERSCAAKKDLDRCMDASIVQRCFNTKNFMKVPFANTEELARKYMTNYLQFDYACGDGYRIAQKHCSFAPKPCQRNAVGSCSKSQNQATCLAESAVESCGRTYGCYIQKLEMLNICYNQKDCGVCNSLSTSINPIWGVCSADVNAGNKITLSFTFYIFVLCSYFIINPIE